MQIALVDVFLSSVGAGALEQIQRDLEGILAGVLGAKVAPEQPLMEVGNERARRKTGKATY